jgi:hypothetical protein
MIVWIVVAQAATRSDVALLEASEKIKYVAQSMAEDYAYFYLHPHQTKYHKVAMDGIGSLEDSILTIARTTRKPGIRQMLDFFAFEKEQLRETLSRKPSKEGVLSVLDSSDAFTEGATKIALLTQYKATFEERMYMACKTIEFRLKEIGKYYMVRGSDVSQMGLDESLALSVEEVEAALKLIRQYQYPNKYLSQKDALMHLWKFGKGFLKHRQKETLPGVFKITELGIEKVVDVLATYHTLNQ